MTEQRLAVIEEEHNAWVNDGRPMCKMYAAGDVAVLIAEVRRLKAIIADLRYDADHNARS